MADGCVPFNPVSEEWTRCKPWIAAALEAGGDPHSIEDVERFIVAGEVQFWPGDRCAAVTEIIGRGTIAHMWLWGGDLRDLMRRMAPSIEAWAKEIGLKKTMGIYCVDQPKWGRVFARQGYQPVAVTVVKEL